MPPQPQSAKLVDRSEWFDADLLIWIEQALAQGDDCAWSRGGVEPRICQNRIARGDVFGDPALPVSADLIECGETIGRVRDLPFRAFGVALPRFDIERLEVPGLVAGQ